jgi:uncharacterized protein YjbI with pentapeptide repeats
MTAPTARRGSREPSAPRLSAPDLPAVLEPQQGLAPRIDLVGARVTGLSEDVSAAHGHLSEARIDGASIGRFDLTGATLADVAVTDLRAVEVGARDGSWRGVEIVGGRIGSLDALRGGWDAVTLRGLRIDYLSLPSAEVTDVLFVDCEIGTLDVPDARLTRVRFERCRADEVDTRGLRAADLDLRGLETLSFTDAKALTGAWLAPRQAELHAVAFAAALGIRVAD